MFSILNKAWVQAESATPPSVTTGAPKWAKAPFYSDLVPSGSRQFASRFRPRNPKVRNKNIITIYFTEFFSRILQNFRPEYFEVIG